MSFKKFFIPLVFLLLISFVSAANVCCEKTKTDEYCLYTDESNCAADSKTASITCEQTSYCKVGCCYSSDEGRCFKNTPKAECESMRATWDPDALCGIQQCNKGCCMIGNEAFFVTPVRCKFETSLYPNITMSFDESISTEQECIAKSRAEDKGCCVSGTECSFTARGSCSTASTVQVGNESSDGFYSGMLCSNDKLKCDCAKQQTTGCVAGEDEVYWFDSCGNRENIFSSDKVASYNNGYVLPKDKSCKLKGANDINCGNCDYSTGNLCGAAPKNVKMAFGDNTCRDVSCSTIYKDDVSVNSGSKKKNGESWCIYDTFPGQARDAVGSRHFRHICINGEELVEPCRDYREEICIQGIMNNEPAPTAYESFKATGDYVESACRDNRWEDCFTCNSQKSCGGECSGKSPDCCIKKCCEDVSVRDCFWLKAGIAVGITGVCVPDVPPGFAFWTASPQEVSSSTKTAGADQTRLVTTPSSSSSTTTTTTPSPITGAATVVTSAAVSTASGTSTITGTGGTGSGSGTCSQANQECTVSWHRGGVSRIFAVENWKCTKNCHCTDHDWIVAGNTLCKAMGDCGAKFNILGKITTDGYANSAAAETKWFKGSKLKESEAGDWKTLTNPSEKDKKEESSGILGGGKFSEFFSKAGLPLAVMVGSGIYTGYQTAWTKGAFTSGMTGGLSTMGNAVGWLFTLGKKDASSIIANWGTTYGTSTIASGASAKGATVSASELSKLGFKDSASIQNALDQEVIKGVGNPTVQNLPAGVHGPPTPLGYENYQIVTDIKVQPGQTITTTPSGGTLMGALNTLMWAYTIYQFVDVFLAQDKSQAYTMSCGVWVAPDGGKDCEKCNQDNNNKPCSEYRCKSLGKLCALINQGTSEEKCVNIHPNDANSPVISPWSEALSKNFTITEITAEGNKGYKVNQKLKPFQSITLGIKTDEPSQCKFGSVHSVDYDQILSFFSDQIYKYEHEITFSLPSDLTTPEALKLTNGGLYNIYIRCKDATGNKNNRDYFIRFSIEASPDMTAPVIERTSVESGSFAPSGVNDTYFSIYTNEPADCRWNFNDTEFDLMDTKFTCADSGFSSSSIYHGLYECKTTLMIKSEGMTDYYFRCKDRKGNVNTESYMFSLRSTKPLYIDSTSPSGTLYQSEVELRAVTSGGAEGGNARCGYRDTDVPFLSMIEFYETNGTIHKQPLVLDKGDYKFFVTCRDLAGNEAYSNMTFKVDVDLEASKLVYIYSEGSVLHLETNEISNCQYSTNSTISYGSGVAMTGTDSITHELTISEPVYYIACIDAFKNEGKFVVYV